MHETHRIRNAQRRPGCEPRRHVKANPSYPVTPTAQRRPGCEPRRHIHQLRQLFQPVRRSTKAGVRTPATRVACQLDRPRGALRSTKAGVRTPATLDAPSPIRSRARSLNEGRGANPGDTTSVALACRYSSTLNEGRGANPGDTPNLPLDVENDKNRRHGKAGWAGRGTDLGLMWALRSRFSNPIEACAFWDRAFRRARRAAPTGSPAVRSAIK